MWLTKKLNRKSTLNDDNSTSKPVLSPSLKNISLETVPFVELRCVTVRNLPMTSNSRYINIKTSNERVKTFVCSNEINATQNVFRWDKEHYLLQVERRENFSRKKRKTMTMKKRLSVVVGVANRKSLNLSAMAEDMDTSLLELELWDYDKKRNVYVGSAYIDLDQLLEGRYILVEEPLCGTNGILSCFAKAHNFGSRNCYSLGQAHTRHIMACNTKFDTYYDSLVVGILPRNVQQETVLDQHKQFLRSKMEKIFVPDRIEHILPILSNVQLMEEALTTGWISKLNLPLNETESEEASASNTFDTVSIKLAVTHLSTDEIVKHASWMGDFPVQNLLNTTKACELGLFHCALIIGPHIIDWDQSGICLPRSVLSADVLLAQEMASIRSLDVLNQVMKSFSKALVDWNLNYSFSELGDKANTGNSYTFVMDILNQIGIPFHPHDIIDQFISSMQMSGTGKMRFLMKPEFRNSFNLDFDSIIFENHLSLNEFIRQLKSVDPEWEKKWIGEEKLLYLFKEFFWAQHDHVKTLMENTAKKIEILTKRQYQENRIKSIQLEMDKLKKLFDNNEKLYNSDLFDDN